MNEPKPPRTQALLLEIKTDIAVIKNDLQHHIKRTDLAETHITFLREENKAQAKSISEELQPVKKHVHMV